MSEYNPRTAEWSYRIIIGFLQGDHEQTESIFQEVYDDPQDTGEVVRELMTFMANTGGGLFTQRRGSADLAVAELQQLCAT